MRRISPVLYYTIYALSLAGGVSLIPGVYGILVGERVGFVLFSYGVLLLAAVWLVKSLLEPSRPLHLDDVVVIAVASWILVPIFAAIPITIAIHIPFVDSWFEAVSGFTTTGLSMFSGAMDKTFHVYVPSVDQLPSTILLWRSFVQWVGGLGILVVFVALALGAGMPPHLVGMAEGRYERLEPSLARSLRRLLLTYAVLTLVSTLLMWFSGMSLFDAINNAMAALSTGGFATHSTSIAYYHSFIVELVVIFAMVLGAANFATHYRVLFKKKFEWLKKDRELHLMLSLGAIGTILGAVILWHWHHFTPWKAFRYSLFQVMTSLTTTGFQTMNLGPTSPAFKFLLALMCIVGGSVLSTAGGIKLYRTVALLYIFKWTTSGTAKVRGEIEAYKIGDRVVTLDEIKQIVAVTVGFLLFWVIGTIATLFIMPHVSLADAMVETASALCTVGISVGLTGAQSPLALKLLYIALMSLGRLEIVPYFAAARIVCSKVKLALRPRPARRRRPATL
ncbi:MAG: TrkH family potassium uptake protein [Crenarchaeota archaeon]|nr:TrkH family potassium uptake protein [Thermoproteota archaeon]